MIGRILVVSRTVVAMKRRPTASVPVTLLMVALFRLRRLVSRRPPRGRRWAGGWLERVPGVSLATPYNLFGSKRAIVVAVLHDVREFEERFSSPRIADPLERIFVCLDISVGFYLADPDFYRTLWLALFAATDGVRRDIFNPKREAFWRGLLDDAVRAGAVAGDIDVDLLLRQLELCLRSTMFEWAVGEIAPQRIACTARYGYALVLLGAAAPEWRGPLRARMLEAQTSLGGGS